MIHTTPHVAITMIEKRKRWDETAKHCPSWQFCSVLVLRSRDSKKKKLKINTSQVQLQRRKGLTAVGSMQNLEVGGIAPTSALGQVATPPTYPNLGPSFACRCEGRRPRGVNILQGPLAESLAMRDWVWWIRTMGLNGVN